MGRVKRKLSIAQRGYSLVTAWSFLRRRRADPNRDPNAEKLGGIIRAGNDEAAKFSEQKGAKMPRNVR